jgi:type IV pilus assembly protein PilB
VENPKSSSFLERIRALPNFDYSGEVATLAARHGESLQLLQAVIDEKFLTKDDACRYWADAMNVAYVDPFASVITDEAIEKIPSEVARKVKAIGLYVLNNVLTVAFASPNDPELVRRLGHIVQMPISPVFALPREIEDAISIHYCTEKGLEESRSELERSSLFDRPEMAGDKLADLAENNALVQIVDEILYFAMRERATDVHMEAQETHCRIRFRIDGNLREILTYSRKLHRALLSRVKIICNLNIAESRFPQDGRFAMQVGSQTANFRVSTIPSAYGEKAAIRILAMAGKKSMMTLEKMMVSQTILEPLRRLVQNPSGIIFVTGPTGSGKTTTLYGCLHYINKPDRKIITVEDPVEYQLNGINQVPVRQDVGMTFASALRAMLRQAPNVVMVGEIRDLETAEIAINASLTGHMVFSTLHTNDAPGAVTRLIDIGVKPFLVSTSLRAAMAQRLVRKICKHCKRAIIPEPNELRSLNINPSQAANATFAKGDGCGQCNSTGYRGRMGIFEIFLINEEVQKMIYEGVGTSRLREKARSLGMRTMREDGARKVTAGLTTIEEVVSITVGDAS